MFEQIRKEMEIDAMVKFKNGRSLYGVILDSLAVGKEISFKFVPNYCIELYRATESQQFVMNINEEQLEMVDIAIK